MIKLNIFILLLLNIVLCDCAYSQHSIPQSLPIEAKTNYYLRQNLECREVVAARDSTIENLNQLYKLQVKATSISQTQVKLANRITASYIDSVESLNSVLASQKIATEKERKRKKNWRKVTIFESLILLGIGFITYSTIAL